jgi:hypothetical protein
VDQAKNEAVDQELVIEEGKGVVAREPASPLRDQSLHGRGQR